jgi:hypothetical protein
MSEGTQGISHAALYHQVQQLEARVKALETANAKYGSVDQPGALEPAASYADDLQQVRRIAGAFPPMIDITRLQPGPAGQMKPQTTD